MTEQTPEPLPLTDVAVPAAQIMTITATSITNPTITIPGADGPLATIHPDGRLEYGEGYEPDEAARQFWESMGRHAQSPEKQFGRPLTARINAELKRGQTAEETLRTLAAMFDGLDRLMVTSSRDWGGYRVDAWLYAVLVGWGCESMEEMQRLHGWDDAAVAKARRYRAAVRAVMESGVAFEAPLHSSAAPKGDSKDGEHVYLSTGCLHGEHGYCQSMTGQQGRKRPAECKFCQARCTCSCHSGEGASSSDAA